MLFSSDSSSAKPGFAETVAQLFPPAPEGVNLSAEPVSRGRRKLWEIEAEHLCIVIGTCVSMPELRRLARQADIAEWKTATDYELHRSAVGAARERTRLATLMHKELERKFPLAVRRFSQTCSDDTLRAWWKEALARGEVAGALWAIMTHPAASPHTLSTAGEELHMLSHQVGASSRADLRRLAELEQENRTLKEQLQRLGGRTSAQLAEKDALINALEARVSEAAAAHRRCEHAEARLRELEGCAAITQLQMKLDAQMRRAQRAEARAAELAEASERCERLERALADARHEAQAAESTLESVGAQQSRSHEAAAQPPCGAVLAGRGVLCVGGRASLVEQYRSLVERCHGEFVHHDGGMETSVARLQALLAAADVVICLTGNVSHAAYYVVKRHCKQHGKPCVLLKNGALTSFAQGLCTLAGTALPARSTHGVLLGSPVPAAEPLPSTR
jgi:hypothetical protein